MPRSSSSRRANKWQRRPPEHELGASLAGMRRHVEGPDGGWSVQRVRGNDSGRRYVCPGCHREVLASVDHIVAWREDGPWGTNGVENRRHWHTGCFERRRLTT